MFTGLIQQTGRLQALLRSAGGWRINVRCSPWPTALVVGESVAVQGACLTVVETSTDGFAADVLDETLARTALAELQTGARLNLERALCLGDRLGGHIVSGHIDETGRVLSIDKQGRDITLAVSCSRTLSRMTVMKGSIAIDGVSLTVAALNDESLAVAVIPHTWSVTSLGDRHVGDRINLESDLLGKHVARLLERGTTPASHDEAQLSEATLRQAGFWE